MKIHSMYFLLCFFTGKLFVLFSVLLDSEVQLVKQVVYFYYKYT